MVRRLDFFQNFSVNQAINLRGSALMLQVCRNFQICILPWVYVWTTQFIIYNKSYLEEFGIIFTRLFALLERIFLFEGLFFLKSVCIPARKIREKLSVKKGDFWHWVNSLRQFDSYLPENLLWDYWQRWEGGSLLPPLLVVKLFICNDGCCGLILPSALEI